MRDWTHPHGNYTVFTSEIDELIWSVQFISGCIVVHKATSAQMRIKQRVKKIAAVYIGDNLYNFPGSKMEMWSKKLASENKNYDSEVR